MAYVVVVAVVAVDWTVVFGPEDGEVVYQKKYYFHRLGEAEEFAHYFRTVVAVAAARDYYYYRYSQPYFHYFDQEEAETL